MSGCGFPLKGDLPMASGAHLAHGKPSGYGSAIGTAHRPAGHQKGKAKNTRQQATFDRMDCLLYLPD